MTSPRCSVVIPAFNVARYLPEAVASVLAQREHVSEIVIVDDGSTDGTADVARAHASGLVRVIADEGHGGIAHARNRGLRECTAEAIVFLDADDRMLPHALDRMLARLFSSPEVALAYGEVRVIDEDGRRIGSGKPPVLRRRRPSGRVLARILRGSPIVAPGAACIRRKDLDKTGWFKDLPLGEDWELYCRLALSGKFSYLHGAPVLEYRHRPGSTTAEKGEHPELLSPAIEAIFGNPAIRTVFPASFLVAERRRCMAGVYGYAGRNALRNRHWRPARRHLLECLLRDPWRPREMVLLAAALLRWLPKPLWRRIK